MVSSVCYSQKNPILTTVISDRFPPDITHIGPFIQLYLKKKRFFMHLKKNCCCFRFLDFNFFPNSILSVYSYELN